MALNVIRNIRNKSPPSSSRVLLEKQEAIEPIQQQQEHLTIATRRSQHINHNQVSKLKKKRTTQFGSIMLLQCSEQREDDRRS